MYDMSLSVYQELSQQPTNQIHNSWNSNTGLKLDM